MRKGKTKRRIIRSVSLLFILMNAVTFFHAYKFTHFSTEPVNRTEAKKLSTFGKIKTVLFGINNPRPVNTATPSQPYQTIKLQSNKQIECWYIKTAGAKGTVVLFHGYGGQKSSLIDKSGEFIKQGYSTLLVDFMGSGGSEGTQTTIGYKEAEEVKTCYDYLAADGEKNIYLFGTSLGAVAVMKAINDYHLMPAGIIIECPFGSMYQTTAARFSAMRVPAFPMAGLLVFWGGVQNGFWAFGHRPTVYAKAIQCPTLLLYGQQDEKVSRGEIDEIFRNLQGPKTLKTYPLAGHENYLTRYGPEWVADVKLFLQGSK